MISKDDNKRGYFIFHMISGSKMKTRIEQGAEFIRLLSQYDKVIMNDGVLRISAEPNVLGQAPDAPTRYINSSRVDYMEVVYV